jgi:hypothetical protein
MRSAPLRATALLACVALLPVTASAATKPFTGPANGWDHVVIATPTPQQPRAQEKWTKSDGEMIVYLSDAGLSYDDIVGMVRKNISDNGLHPSVDRDRTCNGRRAHEVEETFGTSIVHQVIVDDTPGVTKVTYTRPQGKPMPPDVVAAFTAYCGS